DEAEGVIDVEGPGQRPLAPRARHRLHRVGGDGAALAEEAKEAPRRAQLAGDRARLAAAEELGDVIADVVAGDLRRIRLAAAAALAQVGAELGEIATVGGPGVRGGAALDLQVAE